MRSTLILSSCALAVTCALGLSACGGDSRPYDQVPTATPALIPPADANDVASGTGTTATTTPTTTTDTSGGTGIDTSGGTTGGTGVDTGGTGGGTGGGTPADTGGAAPN